MKKALLVLVALVTFGFAANAQENAIGVRFGGGQGYGAELSFQTGLFGSRCEFDLGLNSGDNYTHFNLSGIYQWTGDIANGFGWYAGVGATIGYWDTKNSDADIALGLAGQAGLEYNIPAIPIQLSLDIRPKFWILPNTNFHWGDIALGIRYRF